MKKFNHIPVRFMEFFKKITGAKTWQIESLFVLLILAAVPIVRLVFTGQGWVEWLGVFAVWATFGHASVANRLQEKEEKRSITTGQTEVECYAILNRYFYIKEICWFIYFILIGAYSALVGVIIFLLYGWWRKTWRLYHPLK